jgi:hypothetical protein
MKARDIFDAELPDVTSTVEEITNQVMDEAGARGSIKPLTPAQARARQKRKDNALSNLHDTQASNAIKLRTAQRKAAEA